MARMQPRHLVLRLQHRLHRLNSGYAPFKSKSLPNRRPLSLSPKIVVGILCEEPRKCIVDGKGVHFVVRKTADENKPGE